MNKSIDLQLALAGICQATALVKKTARIGEYDERAFAASLNSIIETEPDQCVDVFGGIDNLQYGLVTLEQQIDPKSKHKDDEITRYIAGVMGLERKLSRKPKTLDALGQRIEQIKRQNMHYSLVSEQMIGNLASIYSDVISPLTTKIQVSGTPALLKQQVCQNKIRALLLAGVRAAVLWRQLGGRRRDVIFRRRDILAVVQEALSMVGKSH